MSIFNWKKQPQQPKIYKILIIRLSSIGDIVLTTPIIRNLRRKFPNVQLDFLVKPSFVDVLKGNPYISNVLLYQPKEEEFIVQLKAEQYDFVIDLHHNLRTLKLKKSLNKPSASFPKLNIQKWLYVNLKTAAFMPDVSIVDRYFEAVKMLGVTNDGEGLDYFIPDEMKTTPDDIPMSHWSGYVACVLGGSKGTKQLPSDKWIALIYELKFPVILLGGPDDKIQGDYIAAAIPNQRVYNACGKFKLNESADLVKKAKVVVSNDTGLMHIAAAFQKPIVSLWGNTTPQLGMFPYYGANNLKSMVSNKLYIAEVKGLGCRPCSKIGFDHCPKKHFKCMEDIDISSLVTAVNTFWHQQ